MRKIKFIIVCIILALSASVNANIKSPPEQLDNEIIISQLKEKNIRLEEQNKILISSASDLRASYYWSLSFAATFLLLFLGVNIYFFRNRYNEDKEYLLKHIDAKLLEGKNNAQKETSKKLLELEGKFEKIIADKVRSSISGINSKIDVIHSNIKYNKIKILEVEIEQTKKTGVEVTLLSQYFQLAQEVKTLNSNGWDWKLSDCLVEITKLLEKGVEIETGDLPELSDFLNNLPNQFSDAVHKIRTIIRKSSA